MRTDATWLLKYLAPLVGGEIIAVGTVRDGNDAPWPKFTVRKSAAPKLLEACKAMFEYEHADDCHSELSGGWQSSGFTEAFGKIADAIAEAEEPGTLLEIEVAQDSEGNGAGFLFGLPAPPKETT